MKAWRQPTRAEQKQLTLSWTVETRATGPSYQLAEHLCKHTDLHIHRTGTGMTSRDVGTLHLLFCMDDISNLEQLLFLNDLVCLQIDALHMLHAVLHSTKNITSCRDC